MLQKNYKISKMHTVGPSLKKSGSMQMAQTSRSPKLSLTKLPSLQQISEKRTTRLCSQVQESLKSKEVNLDLVTMKYDSVTGTHKLMNQDSFQCFRCGDYQIYVVCDGHGQNGQLVSKFVADQLIENIREGIQQNAYILQFHTQLYHQILKRAFLKTNDQLDLKGINIFRSGCTANLLLIVQQSQFTTNDIDISKEPSKETVIYCANVGDSRSVLMRNNQVIKLSEDHRPELPQERIRIIQKGGYIEQLKDPYGKPIGPYRVWLNQQGPGLAMSRSFGDKLATQVGVNAEPTIIEHKMSKEDKCIVQGSDGVWQFLTSREVFNIVQNFDHETAYKEIISESSYRFAEHEFRDDITCVIIYFNQ